MTQTYATPQEETAQRKPLLEVIHLKKYFPIYKGILYRHVNDVRAVDDVSFEIYPGETLALVGESGCGKTTIGRCVVRAYKPTSGQLRYRSDAAQPKGKRADDSSVEGTDLAMLSERELRPYRRDIRMIFQDPF